MAKALFSFGFCILILIFMVWVFVGSGGRPNITPYEDMTDNEKQIIVDWKYEQLKNDVNY